MNLSKYINKNINFFSLLLNCFNIGFIVILLKTCLIFKSKIISTSNKTSCLHQKCSLHYILVDSPPHYMIQPLTFTAIKILKIQIKKAFSFFVKKNCSERL